MDFDTSFGGRPPLEIVIDHTRPIVEVDISPGGSAPPPPLTGTEIPGAEANVSGGSYRPRPIPNATYSVLDIPTSTCKAVRVGCWASSPIDSDALKGKIYPDLLQSLKKDSIRSSPSGFTDLNTLQKLKDDFLRSPSEFPEINNLLHQILNKESPSGFTSSIPGCQLKLTDDNRLIMVDDGPLPSSSVYKCSDVPKEEVAKFLKMIEREEKLGRWNSKDRALKENLKSYEIRFKSQYSYSTMEYRHCITANNASRWKQESSGIMWAGVYGIDDICVVTLSGQHLDWKRVHGCLASLSPKLVLSLFRECVLSELEDLADPTCKHSEEFDRSFDPPFCVVSETPMPDECGDETSSAEYAVPDAVSFVQESGLLEQAKDSGGAIKLAISAFQRLMGKKFEAKEIEVTVLFGRKFGNGYTRELDISEIGDYLADVA